MSSGKKDFIRRFSKMSGRTIEESSFLVDVFWDAFFDHLKEEGCLKLLGLGSFKVHKYKERVLMHYLSGEEVVIPVSFRVIFRPSASKKKAYHRSFLEAEKNGGLKFKRHKKKDHAKALVNAEKGIRAMREAAKKRKKVASHG